MSDLRFAVPDQLRSSLRTVTLVLVALAAVLVLGVVAGRWTSGTAPRSNPAPAPAHTVSGGLAPGGGLSVCLLARPC